MKVVVNGVHETVIEALELTSVEASPHLLHPLRIIEWFSPTHRVVVPSSTHSSRWIFIFKPGASRVSYGCSASSSSNRLKDLVRDRNLGLVTVLDLVVPIDALNVPRQLHLVFSLKVAPYR